MGGSIGTTSSSWEKDRMNTPSTGAPSGGSSSLLRKLYLEYLTQPLHVTAIAAVVYVFGSFRLKVLYDLVRRREHAYSLLQAADWAKERGLGKVTVVETGVASGAGLWNMIRIGEKVTAITGVAFEFAAFDTGTGMPPPIDYRDHPEVFRTGDFPMQDVEVLRQSLPSNARLFIGDVADTIPEFAASLSPEAPVGYVVIDVDYYSSAKAAMEVMKGPANCYLPLTLVYLDDVGAGAFPWANDWCGERLAVREFNDENAMRKLQHDAFMKYGRVYKDSDWLDRVYKLHVLDHPERQGTSQTTRKPRIL
jgi:hypothetical protein